MSMFTLINSPSVGRKNMGALRKQGKGRTKRNMVFSNFNGLDERLGDTDHWSHTFIGNGQGQWSAWRLFKRASRGDAIILNIDHHRLLKLCGLCFLFPFRKFKLISVDILLRKPNSPARRVLAFFMSLLLKQVDIFALYFKDTVGYQRFYGINQAKIRYVPFKVNFWKEHFANYRADPEAGEYVICAGQTLRDLETYIEAVRISGLPAVLLTPGEIEMRRHGTRLVTEGFPDNLRLEVHSDGKQGTFLEWIKNAAIIVIPRFSSDIASTGISTYLCSMAAWRCVILSIGPGAQDVLRDGQAVLVDPESPDQLANAMLRVWNDRSLRKEIAIKGRLYAEQLQGGERLLDDILKLI
jgi:glycosyltransferase involved in cell wall biosynthesis